MNNIEQISSELATGNITVQDAQHKLSVYLFSVANKLDNAVDRSKIEASIKHIENELEQIIFTVKEENQLKEALATLGKAKRLLLNGFKS